MNQHSKMAPINIRIPLPLKNRVEEIALARKHKSGERVTVTDLVIEALEAFVRHQDAQAGPQAQQGQEAAPQPLSAAGRAQRVADQDNAGDEPAF